MIKYLLVILIFSIVIAFHQRNSGFNFWPTFFKSFIGLASIFGVVWNLLN